MAKHTILIADLVSHLQNLRESMGHLEEGRRDRDVFFRVVASARSIKTIVDDIECPSGVTDTWQSNQRERLLRVLSEAYVVLSLLSQDPHMIAPAREFLETCGASIGLCLRKNDIADPAGYVEQCVLTPSPETVLAKKTRKQDIDEQVVAAVLASPKIDIISILNTMLSVFPKTEVKKFKTEVRKRQKRIKDFLAGESRFADLAASRAIFLNLREWNSYTPSVPDARRTVRGGGYFIRYQGQGIAIDPGYDFIRSLCEAGVRIYDIDHILVTHAHDDHTHDFESLLSLVHQYNRQNGGDQKRVHLYLSQSAARKFSGYLQLREVPYISGTEILNPGRKDSPQSFPLHNLGGARLTVLPAYHDDTIALDCSVGLGFKFDFGHVTRTLVFTGDTALFPAQRNEKNEPARDKNGELQIDLGDDGISHALYSVYPDEFAEPELLIAHIGSIKDYEFLAVPVDAHTKRGAKKTRIFYPNHLGWRGLALLIGRLHPGAVVVGELGEELENIRFDLVRGVSRFLQQQNATKRELPFVVPGDLTVHYDIGEAKFFCHQTMNFRPPGELEFLGCIQPENTRLFYCAGVNRTYFFGKAEPSSPKDLEVSIKKYYADMDTYNLTELCSRDRYP